jgi:hypothetical protein
VSSADPGDLAAAIVRIHAAGPDLVNSTYGWFRKHATQLSVDDSVTRIEQVYQKLVAAQRKIHNRRNPQ